MRYAFTENTEMYKLKRKKVAIAIAILQICVQQTLTAGCNFAPFCAANSW